MYIVNRRWLYVTILFCAALIGFYAYYAAVSVPRGGGFIGYTLGIIGTLLVIILMLLPIRKRQYQRPVGSLDVWMRSHVSLGILTGLIVGMHAGFQMIGTISIVLSVVFILTMISGFAGTILYEVLPYSIARMGNNTFREESLLQSLAEMRQEIFDIQNEASSSFAAAVQMTFSGRTYPVSLNPFHIIGWWIRRRRALNLAVDTDQLDAVEQASFLAADVLMTRYQQLDRQMFCQRIIRQWLWSHIPLSAALMTLLLVHIVTELYY
ncbi:MAG: hypothetical protein HOH43_25075 [Candidatus Latescibacteria bacterium]|nr:hypothetical protein [Candidatus Latescibacterota bacterium]